MYHLHEETNRDVCCLKNHGRYMSHRQLFADAHLNLFYQLCTEMDAVHHLQKQHNALVTSVAALLRHTKAVLNLLEALHYNHIHRVSILVLVCLTFLFGVIFHLGPDTPQEKTNKKQTRV